jgi:signal transduction histidine kinase
VRDKYRNIYAVAFSAENVTAHKLQEEKITDQYKKLKRISFRTSHIIRAPLANIIGLVNIIRMNGYASPANEHLFEMIAASAEKLDNILKEIALEATTPGMPGAKPFFE